MKTVLIFISFVFAGSLDAQTVHYDLVQLLKTDQLVTDTGNHAQELNNNFSKQAISLQRIAWLKNVRFTNGTIDIDLRGKDVFLQSFLGIAFHAKDAANYELVYFRPFNFRHTDTARRRWSVQYMVLPDYPFDKLRKEHPLVYENSVNPVPRADEWFHATIIVEGGRIRVYVNHSAMPSLEVKKLGDMQDGMIGLWDDELPGDFANLTISK